MASSNKPSIKQRLQKASCWIHNKLWGRSTAGEDGRTADPELPHLVETVEEEEGRQDVSVEELDTSAESLEAEWAVSASEQGSEMAPSESISHCSTYTLYRCGTGSQASFCHPDLQGFHASSDESVESVESQLGMWNCDFTPHDIYGSPRVSVEELDTSAESLEAEWAVSASEQGSEMAPSESISHCSTYTLYRCGTGSQASFCHPDLQGFHASSDESVESVESQLGMWNCDFTPHDIYGSPRVSVEELDTSVESLEAEWAVSTSEQGSERAPSECMSHCCTYTLYRCGTGSQASFHHPDLQGFLDSQAVKTDMRRQAKARGEGSAGQSDKSVKLVESQLGMWNCDFPPDLIFRFPRVSVEELDTSAESLEAEWAVSASEQGSKMAPSESISHCSTYTLYRCGTGSQASFRHPDLQGFLASRAVKIDMRRQATAGGEGSAGQSDESSCTHDSGLEEAPSYSTFDLSYSPSLDPGLPSNEAAGLPCIVYQDPVRDIATQLLLESNKEEPKPRAAGQAIEEEATTEARVAGMSGWQRWRVQGWRWRWREKHVSLRVSGPLEAPAQAEELSTGNRLCRFFAQLRNAKVAPT